ncbi:hypothetical protein EV401DRAFT_1896474, partial [Pisolithus croceorrhizus]
GTNSGGDCCNADCGEEDQANPEGGSHCSMADGQGMQHCWRAVIVAIHMVENKADPLQHTDGKGMQCHQCTGMVRMWKVGKKSQESHCNTIDRRGMQCCHPVAMWIAEAKPELLQHGGWEGDATLLESWRQCAGMVAMQKVGKKAGRAIATQLIERIAEVGTNALQHGQWEGVAVPPVACNWIVAMWVIKKRTLRAIATQLVEWSDRSGGHSTQKRCGQDLLIKWPSTLGRLLAHHVRCQMEGG